MPVEQDTTVNIACDNPNCPGNALDPADRTGWLFVTSEVYGQNSQQSVFCSTECVSTASRSTPELLVGDLTEEAAPK